MNEHLRPVFEIMLPELERAGIEYWVYGGIGNAGCAGRFLRDNKDVDVFVKEIDLENTRSILCDPCCRNGFKVGRIRGKQRPKFEVYDKKGIEVLSLVPVYLEGPHAKLKFEKQGEKGFHPVPYSRQMLDRVEREICGYRFVTPPDECIRGLFRTYVDNKPKVKRRKKTQIDAHAILSFDERQARGLV